MRKQALSAYGDVTIFLTYNAINSNFFFLEIEEIINPENVSFIIIVIQTKNCKFSSFFIHTST